MTTSPEKQKIRLFKILLSAFLFSTLSLPLNAQISLPKIFNDSMVLQRNIEIPIWGKGETGNSLTIELGIHKITTTIGSDGKWKLSIPSMDAGGPYYLKIYEGNKTEASIVFNEIMIGDVWLASGQSNMEWQVQQAKDGKQEIKNAQYSNIRFFKIAHNKAIQPQQDVLDGMWQTCTPENAKTFSAVAYYFARKLHTNENIPIGIVQATWGGTPVQAWTSREQLLSSSITRQKVLDYDSITVNHFIKDSLDLIRFWDIVYNPKNNTDKTIPQPKYNDSEWQEMKMPTTFKDWKWPFYEGMVWMRKTIEIPKDITGKDLSLNLGHPEMNYSLYFNGNEICKNIWNASSTHTYTIPKNLVKNGRNQIAIRLAVLWGGGGLNPPADSLYLSDGNTIISLEGNWKYMKDLEPGIPKINNYHQYPSYLYNAMINPIIPFGLKGFIWYQGENNVDNALEYRTLFPMMINDWRIRWQQGYLPFLYVQLANYMKTHNEPTESNWALLRESQTMAINQPNTAMACIIDIGEAESIHPLNKQEVGRRLALLAEKNVYNKNIVASGPLFKSYKIDDNKIIVRFDNTGSGLTTANNEELTGFAIAGQDRKFYWAHAEIKGNTVIVSCEKVEKPIAVRYAWADNPVCNLINKEGFPAVPFRTDDW